MAQITTIVGLDIAKDKIDACIRSALAKRTFTNTTEGHRELLHWLSEHAVGRAVMEASGGYEQCWAELLERAGVEVVIVDPRRVRHFAKSAGRLAKNDLIDAEMIAWFGQTFVNLAGKPRDEERQALEKVVKARLSLNGMKERIDNGGEREQPAEVREAYRAVVKALATQIVKLEATAAGKIEHSAEFAKRADIIRSVPGLGPVATSGLVALMPELGHVDNQAAAALLGVAPYDDDSGDRRGQRHILGGRHKLRKLLYMPILGAATQHNPVLMAYYERLLDRGKLKKVALVACMHKLIIILNAMLKRGE
ncbi:IS110 family transposase, partial [Escherichia coli]|nr:IS110 family transposase [Escherichia coli]